MTAEKRRYFRISDHMDLSFRVLKPQVPELKLSTSIIEDSEMLDVVDGELDSLLNQLWDSDPNVARAVGLLNQKLNLLTVGSRPSQSEIMEQYDYFFPNLDVNLSASGVAFCCDVKLKVQDRLELLLLLESTVTSALVVKGTVVRAEQRVVNGIETWYTCINFEIEAKEKEQLIQHIVRRQAKSLQKRSEAV